VSDEDKRYMFIFSFRDITSEHQIHEELTGILTQIQKVLKRFFNISATIGISRMKNDYVSLRALYRESVKAVEKKFFYGIGRCLFQQELETVNLDEMVQKKLISLQKKWSMFDETGRKELEAIVHSFLAAGQIRQEQDVRKLFVRLLHWPAISLVLNEMEVAMLVSTHGEVMQKCETLDESVDAYGHFLDEIKFLRSTKKQLSKEIAQAVQFIQARYNVDISLHQIAEHLHITPNYLSTLFKKELQLNFSEYLTRIRLEKAKELLLNTNLKSYEIADSVGFADDSYFSRAFKKHVGVRPNGFRRLWVNDWTGVSDENSEE
jgi:two-component system response regulator YesN